MQTLSHTRTQIQPTILLQILWYICINHTLSHPHTHTHLLWCNLIWPAQISDLIKYGLNSSTPGGWYIWGQQQGNAGGGGAPGCEVGGGDCVQQMCCGFADYLEAVAIESDGCVACHVTYARAVSRLRGLCLLWMGRVSYEWVMSSRNESCVTRVSHVS